MTVSFDSKKTGIIDPANVNFTGGTIAGVDVTAIAAPSAAFGAKDDPTKGAGLIGDHGRSLHAALRNTNGAQGLKKLLTTMYVNANQARFNIRLIGTSIQTGGSMGAIVANALCDWFGVSQSSWAPFANQASQAVYGWKTQYYSGTYSIRLRAGNADGNAPYVIQAKAKSITVFYSTEADGGTITASTRLGSATAVAQTSINCNGGTSFGNAVTYTLDPSVMSSLTLTAPTGAAYGYLESYVVDAGDCGMMAANTSYGGSSLWNHAGPGGRTVDAGMYATATPSGSLGLLSAFAPTHAQVKPALLIYSGPTNDVGVGAATFSTNLTAAVTAAVANGTALILVIEPINLAYDTAGANKTAWQACRDVFYAQAAAYPNSVFVYDFDAFISDDLHYSATFHQNGDTTHPNNTDFDPHITAAADLCQRLGIPNKRKFSRDALQRDYATVFAASAVEPPNAPIGSLWTDISNAATPLQKKKIANNYGVGLWECLSGDNSVAKTQNVIRSANALYGGASVTDVVNFMGNPARLFSNANAGFWLGDEGNFVGGDVYTLSFLAEAQSLAYLQTTMSLNFGTSGNMYTYDPQLGRLVASIGAPAIFQVSSSGFGDIRRYAIAFKFPTAAEFTTNGVGGDQKGAWSIQAIAGGNTLLVWDWKVERGASVTTGAAAKGALIYTKATDPVAAEIPDGRVMTWCNTTSNVTKQWINIGGVLKSVAFA